MTAETDWRPGALPPDWSDFGLTDQGTDWQERGLCAKADPKAFYPGKGGSTWEAKQICAGCDVRQECLQYALDNRERFGVWGGLTQRERRKLRKPTAPTPLIVGEPKVCAACGTEKPRSEFYSTSRGGPWTRCKDCVRAAKREREAAKRAA